MRRLNEYIIERLQYGVIYVDSGKHIKVINRAAQAFFHHEVSSTDMTLQDFSSILYQKYMQFIDQKNQNSFFPGKQIIEEPYLQVNFLPTSVAKQPAVLIIIDDMAVVAQQAQQLKLAALGRFSAGISHELRNPLGIILHAVQLMDEGQRLNQEDARLNQLIINNCKRMNTVIENVLNVSRRHHAKPEPIALTQFLKQFKHEFCLINTCDLVLSIGKNKKNTIVFDKGHLEQILVILCDNAMQHGRDKQGGVHVNISIRQQEHYLILLVSDTGPGISPELRKDVYEPFFSTVKMGNGMGLFIARDLCEINQTQLNLLDTPQGCCFSITFTQDHEMHR